MKTLVLTLVGLLVLIAVVWTWQARPNRSPAKTRLAVSIKPRDVADALHAVLAAEREVYLRECVEPTGPGAAKPPAPCRLLRLGNEAMQTRGAEFFYVLRARNPLDPRNRPATSTEAKGLESIAQPPYQPYYTEELLGGRYYFTAIYPETASSRACLDCHHSMAAPASHPWQPGDVLGGLVVRLALEL